MIIERRIHWRLILRLAVTPVLFSATWTLFVYLVYWYFELRFLAIPFLPIGTIGTAVAFYVGFKNNSAYARFWEGRIIWGGIVNESRSWATAILTYVDENTDPKVQEEDLQRLIYRHLAWINSLRIQLRAKSRFEENGHPKTKERLNKHREHMRNDWDDEVRGFLSPQEFDHVKAQINPATHLLKAQGRDLRDLHQAGRINDMQEVSLMAIIRECFALQGKCERIKNTPFPRQYAEYSKWFTRIFILLVPFGLLNVFASHVAHQLTPEAFIPMIPMLLAACLITWVFVTMEAIGDASEDPFERSVNDVPMNALCRTIERDLRQMLGETKLPEAEKPAGFVLY
ncbi:MAG: hypothetical protein MK135_04675 [Polyangiaceae bacterium]|nr:hypothetical protein [Polyangiaceae bacterium]